MTTVEKIEQWAIDRNLHTQDPKGADVQDNGRVGRTCKSYQ